jgi:hypothetical protein
VTEEPPLEPELVRDFVIAGHGDMQKTKALLEAQPALLNAGWDWGGGDWETALGGAAHTGSREVANYLIARGARMDIFAAAMLGDLEIVRAMLAAWPELTTAAGPHGIPLLAHAQIGGEPAQQVVKLLMTEKEER